MTDKIIARIKFDSYKKIETPNAKEVAEYDYQEKRYDGKFQ